MVRPLRFVGRRIPEFGALQEMGQNCYNDDSGMNSTLVVREIIHQAEHTLCMQDLWTSIPALYVFPEHKAGILPCGRKKCFILIKNVYLFMSSLLTNTGIKQTLNSEFLAF